MSQLTLEAISLEVPIYHQSAYSFRSLLPKISLNNRFSCKDKSISVRLLDNVSLDLKKSDRLGIIGPNGAGKTTLLKIMAGIYKPTLGRFVIEGRVSCVLGIGYGMDDDATGYDNIFLCGLFLGFTNHEMKKRVEEIIEFSELNEYIYLPLRTYSAGMRSRLAFSIATSYSPDILLMDEGIGTGDAAFIKKAQARLKSFMTSSNILVMASHSNSLITSFCNRVMFLEKGKKIAEGDPDTIIDQYMQTTV